MTSQPRDAPQFYLTSPSLCPYLPGKEERKVFTHIVGKRARDLNEILTEGGFRRSQTIAYRPACENCRACVASSRRRVRTVPATCAGSSPPQPRPHRRGDAAPALLGAVFPLPALPRLAPRHTDGGMADMTVLDYSMMIEDSHVDTRIVEYRRRGIRFGQSRAAGSAISPPSCLTDEMADGPLHGLLASTIPRSPTRSSLAPT